MGVNVPISETSNKLWHRALALAARRSNGTRWKTLRTAIPLRKS